MVFRGFRKQFRKPPNNRISHVFCKKVLGVCETFSFVSFDSTFRRRNLKVSQTRKTD